MLRALVEKAQQPGPVTPQPDLSDHEVLTGFAIMLYELHNQALVRAW